MIDRETVIGHLMTAGVIEEDGCGLFLSAGLASEVIDAALAIAKKAVDGQKQLRRETEAMAECMDMVRQDLITAGVVDKSVPPMMLAEAVIAAQQKALLAEREACARINAEKSERLAQEAEQAAEEGDRDTCTSNRAAAHLLSVCAAHAAGWQAAMAHQAAELEKAHEARRQAQVELAAWLDKCSRIGLDIDRALCGHVNEQSPVAVRLRLIAEAAAPKQEGST